MSDDIQKLTDEQLLDRIENAYYQSDQGWSEEHGWEASRLEEYRAEALRRMAGRGVK